VGNWVPFSLTEILEASKRCPLNGAAIGVTQGDHPSGKLLGQPEIAMLLTKLILQYLDGCRRWRYVFNDLKVLVCFHSGRLNSLAVAPGRNRLTAISGFQDPRDHNLLGLCHQVRLREAGGISGYHLVLGLGPEGAVVGFDSAAPVLVFHPLI